MNDGEYLELANDLKDQYDKMKEKYERRIAELEAEVRFAFVVDQFKSSRPFVRYGRYTATNPLRSYACPVCDKCHPEGHHCGT